MLNMMKVENENIDTFVSENYFLTLIVLSKNKC